MTDIGYEKRFIRKTYVSMGNWDITVITVYKMKMAVKCVNGYCCHIKCGDHK